MLCRILCSLGVALVIAPVAVAARAPTLGEREAITLALPKYFRDAPVECIWIDYPRVERRPPRQGWSTGPQLPAAALQTVRPQRVLDSQKEGRRVAPDLLGL
jgi:hypothetical protein